MAEELRSTFWRESGGKLIACVEKLKVLEENLAEIRSLAADAFEDAVLMGCAPDEFRKALHAMIDALATPYRRR